ncbi:DUF4136 domain-containing protein [Robertkochia solimangrovi]|uniref:DUF4136 domain-containing protein n=1 Tax=Robertkochia solimangrovi TaxID=2213046 RepID=UPI00117DAD93|nr:DUF4136 domain-containing protein [Robertkochia solimangrovi]TRZ44253.1 DUF4136 domain-containing protein [Robertkochia solimangrovi]
MRQIFILLFFFILYSCNSVKVTYDFDKEAKYDQYKTYAFFPQFHSGLSELDQRRLVRVLEDYMGQHGFAKVNEDPDFYLNVTSAIYEVPSGGSSVGIGVGGTGGNVGGGMSVGIPVGQPSFKRELVFDLVDVAADALFWQAVCQVSVPSGQDSPSKREAILTNIVEKAFSNYPPQIKK